VVSLTSLSKQTNKMMLKVLAIWLPPVSVVAVNPEPYADSDGLTVTGHDIEVL
jgi:hypothetical protein